MTALELTRRLITLLFAGRNRMDFDYFWVGEDHYQVRSTILTSQLPVSRWHEQIGDPTLANGMHNVLHIEIRGDSTRKNRGKPNAK